MRRSPLTLVLLCAATLSLIACGGDDEEPTPTPTPVVPVSEVVTGNLTPFSARIHTFRVDAPGAVIVTLTGIIPNDTSDPTTIGVDLGTALGPSICQVTVGNTDVQQTEGVSGTATAVGTLCVRVYDVEPAGLTQPVDYELTITHF